MAETDVIHLVWNGAGFECFRAFLLSYRRYAAGVDHDLVILYNGFRSEELDPHRTLLEEIKHRELITPRPMLDIAAYFWAAEKCGARFVGFLNSYSTLLADNWLQKLVDQVRLPGVGAAGATGTWESVYTAYAKRLRQLGSPRSPAAWPGHLYRLVKLRRYRAQFNAMPNPHLRSNAFLIDRARWLRLKRPPLMTKSQTLQFENGKHSMSSQLVAAGLQLYVVDRDGKAYAPEGWPESRTYRHGQQEKLLVADNRTRQYDEADETGKRYLEEIAWG